MEEPKRNYYAIIPANVRYDKRLRDKAKLLYGEITALCNEKGYCWASNKYFAELYGVSKTTISTLIRDLVKYGYIKLEIIYKEGTKEIIERRLYICDTCSTPIKENLNTPIKENLKDNNKVINNDNTDNIENPIIHKLLDLGFLNESDNLEIYEKLFGKLSEQENFNKLEAEVIYIAKQLIKNEFKDENEKVVMNKYGYLKNALEFNFDKFKNKTTQVDGEYDWLNDTGYT